MLDARRASSSGMLRKSHGFTTFLAVLLGALSAPPTYALSEAKADSTAGIIWNLWNNVDSGSQRWLFNPGGSTYRLQAHTAPGALPAGEPPAAPAALPPINVVFPGLPPVPPALKFIQNAAGAAINGKDGVAPRPVWGPGPAGGPVVAGALPNLGRITGQSANGAVFWSATTNALANAAATLNPFPPPLLIPNHSFAKDFDPWSFHDFMRFEPDQPDGNDFLTMTQALVYTVDLDVSKIEPSDAGLAGSMVFSEMTGLPSSIDPLLYNIDLLLEKTDGGVSFTRHATLGSGVRLFDFSIDDKGTPGDTSDDDLVLGNPILDPLTFINASLDSFFDETSETVVGMMGFAVAIDLPFGISEFDSPGLSFGAIHQHAAFADVRPSSVPEPYSIFLMAIAVAGLIAQRQKQR